MPTAVIATPLSGSVYESSGTSVSVASGADVSGSDAATAPPQSGLPAVRTGGGSVSASGGTLAGGNDPSFGWAAGAGLESWGDSLTLSGGAFAGGAGVDCGAPGLLSLFPPSLSVSGGSYSGGAGGGAGPYSGGTGAILCLNGSASGTVSGGSFSGGSPGGLSLAVCLSGSATLTLSGGSFSGDLGLNLRDSSVVTVTGSGLSYSAGVLSGTLTSGAAVSVAVRNLGSTLTAGGTATALTFAP